MILISDAFIERQIPIHELKKLINNNNEKLQIKVDFKFLNIQSQGRKYCL